MPVVDYYVFLAVITGLVVDADFVIGLWLSESLARTGIRAKTDSKGGRRRFDGRRIILFAGVTNLVFGGVLATQGFLSLWAIPLFIGGLALIGKAATMRRALESPGELRQSTEAVALGDPSEEPLPTTVVAAAYKGDHHEPVEGG